MSQYEYIGNDYGSGLRVAYMSGKCGYIDKSGNEIIPFIYEEGHDFQYQMSVTAVRKNGKWGLVDINGSTVVDCKYDEIGKWQKCDNTMLAECKRENYVGVIDTTGKEIIPYVPDIWSVEISKDGYIYAKRWEENAYTYNVNGVLVAPSEQFDVLSHNFHDGLALYCKDEKYGYVNKQLQIVIPAQYDSALSFCDGMAMVEKDGKYGFINSKGICVIPFVYDGTCSYTSGPLPFFNHCSAGMYLNGKAGLIDRHGTPLTGFIYDEIAYTNSSEYVLTAQKDGKNYSLNLDGQAFDAESMESFYNSQHNIFKRFVENGDDFFLLDLSHVYMGWLSSGIYSGLDIKQDSMKAFDCLNRAANSKNISESQRASALEYLATYFYMDGPLKNLEYAKQLYRQAADMNSTSAQIELQKLF